MPSYADVNKPAVNYKMLQEVMENTSQPSITDLVKEIRELRAAVEALRKDAETGVFVTGMAAERVYVPPGEWCPTKMTYTIV